MRIKFKLKEARWKKEMSLRKLSELSGVSKSQISAIENDTSMPTLLVICRLAAALELQPEEYYECIE